MRNKLYAILLGSVLASCSLNGFREDDVEKRTTWLSVGVSCLKTYATDDGLLSESKINTCHIVLFDENGAFEKTVETLNPASGKSDVFTIPVGKKKILAYVNAPAVLSSYLKGLTNGATFEAVKNYALTLTNPGDISPYATNDNDGSFTMTNEDCETIYDLKYYGTEEAAKNAPVVVNVKRVVAKVEVKCALVESGLKLNGTIDEVKTLLNSTNNSSYPFANVLSGVVQDLNFTRNDATVATGYYMHPENNSFIWNQSVDASGNVFSSPIYCLENTNRFADQYEDNTTHLLVRVKFTPSSGAAGDGSFWVKDGSFSATDNNGVKYEGGYMYYRIYFKHDIRQSPVNDMLYGVVRNCWYKVTITSFSGVGAPTYQRPAKTKITTDGKVQVSINVVPWNVIEQSVEV